MYAGGMHQDLQYSRPEFQPQHRLEERPVGAPAPAAIQQEIINQQPMLVARPAEEEVGGLANEVPPVVEQPNVPPAEHRPIQKSAGGRAPRHPTSG